MVRGDISAHELGARTVAVPAVSTGAFGWPVEDAARVAVGAVHRARTAVAEVRFVVVDQAAVEVLDRERSRRGPTDARIAADLRALPAERWRELFATADALTDADRAERWGGGERLGPHSFSTPHPVYSERVRALVSSLPSVVFDWGSGPRTTRSAQAGTASTTPRSPTPPGWRRPTCGRSGSATGRSPGRCATAGSTPSCGDCALARRGYGRLGRVSDVGAGES